MARRPQPRYDDSTYGSEDDNDDDSRSGSTTAGRSRSPSRTSRSSRSSSPQRRGSIAYTDHSRTGGLREGRGGGTSGGSTDYDRSSLRMREIQRLMELGKRVRAETEGSSRGQTQTQSTRKRAHAPPLTTQRSRNKSRSRSPDRAMTDNTSYTEPSHTPDRRQSRSPSTTQSQRQRSSVPPTLDTPSVATATQSGPAGEKCRQAKDTDTPSVSSTAPRPSPQSTVQSSVRAPMPVQSGRAPPTTDKSNPHRSPRRPNVPESTNDDASSAPPTESPHVSYIPPSSARTRSISPSSQRPQPARGAMKGAKPRQLSPAETTTLVHAPSEYPSDHLVNHSRVSHADPSRSTAAGVSFSPDTAFSDADIYDTDTDDRPKPKAGRSLWKPVALATGAAAALGTGAYLYYHPEAATQASDFVTAHATSAISAAGTAGTAIYNAAGTATTKVSGFGGSLYDGAKSGIGAMGSTAAGWKDAALSSVGQVPGGGGVSSALSTMGGYAGGAIRSVQGAASSVTSLLPDWMVKQAVSATNGIAISMGIAGAKKVYNHVLGDEIKMQEAAEEAERDTIRIARLGEYERWLSSQYPSEKWGR